MHALNLGPRALPWTRGNGLFPSTLKCCPVAVEVKLPAARIVRAALAVPQPVEKDSATIDGSQIRHFLGWQGKGLTLRIEELAQKEEGPVRVESIKKEIFRDAPANDDDGRSHSAKLPWMDPSLQYANVMWFKGPYNTQIFVTPDESEASIVKRFRIAVSRAGVVRECIRRRYRETAHDTIKRKQKEASFLRRRLRQKETPKYTFPPDNVQAKKTSPRKKKKSARFVRPKTLNESESYDSDDDVWEYTQ